MPAKPKFIVVAQRSNGQCYVDCELHRATSFAVKKQWKSKGRVFLQTLSRHSVRTQAQAEADHRTRAASPLAGIYKLGQRMAPRPEIKA